MVRKERIKFHTGFMGKGWRLWLPLLQGDAATYNFHFLTVDEEVAASQLSMTSVGSDFSPSHSRQNIRITKSLKMLSSSLSHSWHLKRQAHMTWTFTSIVFIQYRHEHNQSHQQCGSKNLSSMGSFSDPGGIWVKCMVAGVGAPGLLTCSGSSLLVRTPHGSDSSGVQLNCQSWWTWPRTFCTRKSAACGWYGERPSCGAYIHRRTWMWRYISGTGNSVYLRASADASLGSRPVWTFSHSGHTGKA